MQDVLDLVHKLIQGQKLYEAIGYASAEDFTTVESKNIKALLRYLPTGEDGKPIKTPESLKLAYVALRVRQEMDKQAPTMKDRVMAVWNAEPNLQAGWTWILKRLDVKEDTTREVSIALNELMKEGWLIQVKNTKGHLLYQRPTRREKGESGQQVFKRHQEAGTARCSKATFKRRVKKGMDPDSAAITPSNYNDESEPKSEPNAIRQSEPIVSQGMSQT